MKKMLVVAGTFAAPMGLLAQADPAYQTAIETGLASANTAGQAILAAGAVIVVTMIIWKVIKKFANRAG